MQLYEPGFAVFIFNDSVAFELSPVSMTVTPVEFSPHVYATTFGNGLDIPDLTSPTILNFIATDLDVASKRP